MLNTEITNKTQNIDNYIPEMLEYYAEYSFSSLDDEMYENGVSWSDFI